MVAASVVSCSVMSGNAVVVVGGAKVVVVGGAFCNFIGNHTELQSFQKVSLSCTIVNLKHSLSVINNND